MYVNRKKGEKKLLIFIYEISDGIAKIILKDTKLNENDTDDNSEN